MSNPLSKRDRILQLFEPDSQGKSHWVEVDQLPASGIGWTKNGNIRRGVAFGFGEVSWEFRRVAGPRSEIVAMRMVGWNSKAEFTQVIISTVRNDFVNAEFCNISCLPVPRQDREIDHRFGNKTHPDYVALYAPESQTSKGFQLIHRVLNLQKRQMCVECVESGSRPAHPELGYAEGGVGHPTRFPCRGCFLAEPERFRNLN